MRHFQKLIGIYCLVSILYSCSYKKSELLWEKNFYNIGSQSSLRVADLNNDGILDIVMGAAKGEGIKTDQGILAIDGNTGNLLWQQEAKDQVFGSATFHDITNDGVPDVFMGGRSPNLRALDGTNGNVIWEYKYRYENDSILKYARYNFYNSVLIPDQNQNGYPELLTVNGGNVTAVPFSEENRFPGVLMVIDSKTGKILAADLMPDGKESYMSPLYFEQPETKENYIVFGSGGETISGHLYLAKLADLMEMNLANAKIIASEKGHGFIAPPVVADISNDSYFDIIAISHGSSVFAIDGKEQQALWHRKIPDTESSNSFAVGHFTDDKIPDFFTFVSKGEWPNSTGSLQVLLDGSNGAIAYVDSLGCAGFSSPVAYDLNNDGIDEAIISINEFECDRGYADSSDLIIENKLVALDFKSRSANLIDGGIDFKNIFSTPWIGDLDKDGYLDIVYCQYYSPNGDLLGFLGMQLKRISTNVRIGETPLWGAYMGSQGNGIFPMTVGK